LTTYNVLYASKNKQIEVLYENIIILSNFQLTLVIMGNRFNSRHILVPVTN